MSVSFAADPQKESAYIFSDESTTEKERLKRLNEIYNESTTTFLSPYMQRDVRVLEIGPGTGEIGCWIANKIGQANYAALDISAEAIDTLRKNIPEGTCVTGSVTEIEALDGLKGKKFDVIFIRWVLAYLPKEQMHATAKLLFERFLSENGSLICEECDLYKVHCIQNDAEGKQLDVKTYKDWITLSSDVQSLDGVNADFALGSKLQEVFAGFCNGLSVHEFQPRMNTPEAKSIPVLAMQAAKSFLLSKQVRTEEELEQMTKGLQAVASDPSISVNYLRNTTVTAKRVK